ncbi:TspO/MBR related protein [Microbacterium sp. AG157]|uniref:TspO/MBR family protein n=1 Tax=Microbacterium TaxID=33882 RepID=UPI000CCFAB5E|nr:MULTISPECIES: TspO/MBR family protein [Microbacterium]PNW09898.1 tryptophan-rich sensory protein [Microbacterium testaceum]REC99914.1 TspO/MBR related protein [Microbacterium sp. AG157]WJS91377.1 tryptophan-rich sensory protein [Microbacterium testaceum]
MNTAAQRRGSDLARQIVVLSAVSFMLIAAVIGAGAFGNSAVQDQQGGALNTDGSYLAPAGPAFSIWSIIYLGLISYAIWQALPGQRTSPRQRALGWLVALTMTLNGLWLVAARFGTLFLTVVVIALLLAALGWTFRVAVSTREPRGGVVDSVLIDAVTGLHLGWVTLATVANTAAWLTTIVPKEWENAADAIGIAVLIVVALIGLAIAWRSSWRLTPALALAWGLSWLAVERFTGEPQSAPIGVTALIVAAVVLLPPVIVNVLRLIRPSVD